MSSSDRVPWPIWAIVTILVAVIGAYSAIKVAEFAMTKQNVPSSPSPVSPEKTITEPPQKAQSDESRCYDLVQGRIAWDYQGNRTWSANNAQDLCRGTTKPDQPGRCFDRVMHGGINWGGGTQWQWGNALKLCAGTNDADRTISCFQAKIREGVAWSAAIDACKGAGR